MSSIRNSRDAVAYYREAAEAYLLAADRLAELNARRATEKVVAIARLCEQEHPATPGKKYSLTAATDVLQIDPNYSAYKAEVAKAESALRQAEEEKIAARLEAELAIAVARAEVGVA